MSLTASYPQLQSLLARVEAGLERAWADDSGFLVAAARRALSGPGKRLRPAILLLSAECAGGATDATIALAGVVELLHLASLIHDDVVDAAPSRRGRESANALWGDRVSVLLGDYLVARALVLLPAGERERFVPALARIAARMCSGQVRELQSAGRPLSEREYEEIARDKTGSLLAFCGWAGAQTAGAPADVADALSAFGDSFGVAFQFADDILDLVGSEGRSGKPEGRDLRERKFTLPLILAGEMGGQTVRAELGAIIAGERISERDVAAARRLIESTGAVEAAWARVRDLLGRAERRLAAIPEGEAKRALVAACGDLFPMPVMAEHTR